MILRDRAEENKPFVTVTLQPWDYTCGDGCCSESGQKVTVNGVEVTDYGNQDHVLIRSILEHLGYKVEIIGLDSDGEVAWGG
jgi:hypothetical protein